MSSGTVVAGGCEPPSEHRGLSWVFRPFARGSALNHEAVSPAPGHLSALYSFPCNPSMPDCCADSTSVVEIILLSQRLRTNLVSLPGLAAVFCLWC